MAGFNNTGSANLAVIGNNVTIIAATGQGVNFLQGSATNVLLSPTGVLSTNAGTSTANVPGSVSQRSISSGVSFVANANSDAMVYIPIVATTTGTVTITMGPTTGAENTIIPTSNLTALSGPAYTIKVPMGWLVIATLTGTTVVFGTVTTVRT